MKSAFRPSAWISSAVGHSLLIAGVFVYSMLTTTMNPEAQIQSAELSLQSEFIQQPVAEVVAKPVARETTFKDPVKMPAVSEHEVTSQDQVPVFELTTAMPVHATTEIHGVMDWIQPEPTDLTVTEDTTPPVQQTVAAPDTVDSERISPSRPANNPPPPYPRLAVRRGYEGLVILQVNVSSDGQCFLITVETSSGYPILDEAAVKAVRQWTFHPAKQDGHYIESHLSVPIRFVLQD